jgi:excisionase family DNA binding protein
MQIAQPLAARRDGLATIEQAAKFLAVGRTTVYAMLRDGQLAAVKFRNARRIPWSALYKLTDDVVPSNADVA